MKRKYHVDDIRLYGVRRNQNGWFVVAYCYGENKVQKRVTLYLEHRAYANKVADILERKFEKYAAHAIDVEEGYIWKLETPKKQQLKAAKQ